MDDILPPPRPLTRLLRPAPLKPPPRTPVPPTLGRFLAPSRWWDPSSCPGHAAPAPLGAVGRRAEGCRLTAPPDTALGVTAQTLCTDRRTRCGGTDGRRARPPAHACVRRAWGCSQAITTPWRSGLGSPSLVPRHGMDGTSLPRHASPAAFSRCARWGEAIASLQPVAESRVPQRRLHREAGAGSGRENLPWVPRVGACQPERGWGCSDELQRRRRDSTRPERGFGTGVGAELCRLLGPKSG